MALKNLPANAGDTRDVGLIAGLGRSPGVGNGNILSIHAWKFHGLRAWRAVVYGAAKSWIQPSA